MSLKRKYEFYAIFDPCEDGGFGVRFPDVPGMHSGGDDIEDAKKQAREGLAGHIVCLNDYEAEIPVSTSTPETISLEPGEKLVKIETDLAEFFPERFPKHGGSRSGAGRPKKKPEERTGRQATRQVAILLTDEEFDDLTELAERAKKTKAEYIRGLFREKKNELDYYRERENV